MRAMELVIGMLTTNQVRLPLEWITSRMAWRLSIFTNRRIADLNATYEKGSNSCEH